MLEAADILITGGTGTLGQAIVRALLESNHRGRIIVFSRDEYKQWQMRQAFRDERLRYFIGDVRDKDRLVMAMRGVKHVIHAAAMKRIEVVEYNPMEAVATNVTGTQNALLAAMECGVHSFVFVSTDKAANPTSLYGATKLTGERMTLAAKVYAPLMNLSVARLVNIAGSRGSIVEALGGLRDGEAAPIHDIDMTRFWMSPADAARFCIDALAGDGVLEPRASAVNITDVIEAVVGDRSLRIIGRLPNEKVHEELAGVSSENAPKLSIQEIKETLC